MAEPQRERERQPLTQVQMHRAYDPMAKPGLPPKGPSISRILAVIALLPIGFTFLTLAGITLTGTIIGLCVATPLFVIFSPVLVPAAITIGLAMTGFLTSGAFGLTALSSFSWVLDSFRQATGSDVAEQAKRRAADVAGFFGQKTNEVSQHIRSKAYEVGRTDTGGVQAEAGGKTEST